MEMTSYTVSTQRNFTVDGSEVADVVNKFSEDWLNNPMELHKLIADIYSNGIKRGIELCIGQNVTIVDKERKVEGGESQWEVVQLVWLAKT